MKKMLKKLALGLTLYALTVLFVATSVMASPLPEHGIARSNSRNLTSQDAIISELNNLDLIGDYEFFPLERNMMSRNLDSELLHFDSVECFEKYLNSLTLALREDVEFSFDDDLLVAYADVLIQPMSSSWFTASTSAPAPVFTRFNISLHYMFHGYRTTIDHWISHNPGPVITNQRITDSWFTGMTNDSRWTHRSSTMTLSSFGRSRTDFRFSVSGTLFYGVVIAGVDIGFTTNETLTGGVHARHLNANSHTWPAG